MSKIMNSKRDVKQFDPESEVFAFSRGSQDFYLLTGKAETPLFYLKPGFWIHLI